MPHKIYQVPYQPNWIEDLMNKYQIQGHQFQFKLKILETLVGLCEAALNSSEVLEQLRGFDLIIYDNLALCGPLIGEHLGLQKVEFLPLPPSKWRPAAQDTQANLIYFISLGRAN